LRSETRQIKLTAIDRQSVFTPESLAEWQRTQRNINLQLLGALYASDSL
jgi:hypothetical protein